MKQLTLLIAMVALIGCKKEDVNPPKSSSGQSETACECAYYEMESNAETGHEWITIQETPVVHPSCQDSMIEYVVIPYPDGLHAAKYLRAIGCDD